MTRVVSGGGSTSVIGGARGSRFGSCQRHLAAWFARTGGPPPVAPGGQAGPAHPHHYRPSGAPVGLIVGLIAAVAAVTILVVGILSSRTETPTLAELKATLGVPASVQSPNIEMDQVEFVRRVGKSKYRDEDAAYIYLYYDVLEGTAVIVVERGAWEIGKARIRHILKR